MYTKSLCNSVTKHILQVFIFHQKSDLRFWFQDFFFPSRAGLHQSTASPAAMRA